MPSVSAKQAKTMRAAAHNPAFAKKVGVPVSVAKDFSAADMATEHRISMPGGAVRNGSYVGRKR